MKWTARVKIDYKTPAVNMQRYVRPPPSLHQGSAQGWPAPCHSQLLPANTGPPFLRHLRVTALLLQTSPFMYFLRLFSNPNDSMILNASHCMLLPQTLYHVQPSSCGIRLHYLIKIQSASFSYRSYKIFKENIFFCFVFNYLFFKKAYNGQIVTLPLRQTVDKIFVVLVTMCDITLCPSSAGASTWGRNISHQQHLLPEAWINMSTYYLQNIHCPLFMALLLNTLFLRFVLTYTIVSPGWLCQFFTPLSLVCNLWWRAVPVKGNCTL